MIPTSAQLITIVVLLVPGFLSIQVFSKLMPSRRLSTFDATVISIIFSLFIHGTFTTLYSYVHINLVTQLMDSLSDKKWSASLSSFVALYIFGLFLYSIVVGILLAKLKDNGKIHKFLNWAGFNYSDHENLWDEMIYLYSINDVTPIVIIHLEDTSYAGWIYRASFDLEKNERKEIILSNPRYKKTDSEWTEMDVKLIYLDLSEVCSIEYVNGNLIQSS